MRKDIGFGIITIVLVCIIAFFWTQTARSQDSQDRLAREAWYDSMESDYISQIRSVLTGAGYENCGINMTKITDDEGSREYSVIIYNTRFEKISNECKTGILNNLEKIGFADDKSSFSHQLSF